MGDFIRYRECPSQIKYQFKNLRNFCLIPHRNELWNPLGLQLCSSNEKLVHISVVTKILCDTLLELQVQMRNYPIYFYQEMGKIIIAFSLDQAPTLKKKACSTQLSMQFFLPINVKMPTIVGILTFMTRKNSILGLSKPEKS